MDEDANSVQEKRAADLGAAVFFLIWAGVGWASIAMNTERLIDRTYGLDPGPALLPVIALTILTVGAVAMAGMAIARRGRSEQKPASKLVAKPLVTLFLGSVAVFPVLLAALGYIWGTSISVFVWSALLAPDALRRPFHTIAVSSAAAVSVTFLVYVGFEIVIGALLPR